MELLGPILEMFVSESILHEPIENGSKNGLWITSSYDASSHFEIASEEILKIYEQIVGEKLDLNIEQTDDDD